MSVSQVLMLLSLVITANVTPVLVGMLSGQRWNAPLDGGLRFVDRRPLLGPTKTIRGVIASVLATAVLAAFSGLPPAVGAGFAGLAMAGDICTSFVKRRFGLASSRSAPLLDQLPESLLPLCLMQPLLGGTISEISAVAASFTIIDLVLSKLYRPERAHSK